MVAWKSGGCPAWVPRIRGSSAVRLRRTAPAAVPAVDKGGCATGAIPAHHAAAPAVGEITPRPTMVRRLPLRARTSAGGCVAQGKALAPRLAPCCAALRCVAFCGRRARFPCVPGPLPGPAPPGPPAADWNGAAPFPLSVPRRSRLKPCAPALPGLQQGSAGAALTRRGRGPSLRAGPMAEIPPAPQGGRLQLPRGPQRLRRCP